MNYHNILHDDMRNGDGLRVTLFVSGCEHHCYNCQNPQTWDCNSGIEFDEEAKEEIFEQLNQDYISGITFTGGDPLHSNNLEEVQNLINQIRLLFPKKTIWLYTGYTVFVSSHDYVDALDDYEIKKSNYLYCKPTGSSAKENLWRSGILNLVDVVVDGHYEEDKKDLSLQFRGSSNQRLIAVKESLEKGEIVLWNN